MVGHKNYSPPPYIPLDQSDAEVQQVSTAEEIQQSKKDDHAQWSSGICACFDDPQSCILLGLPGCFVACYACGYRKTLRSKYNLQEAPCGDFATHFFCHLCAICQEYREIRERSGDSNSSDLSLVAVTAPQVQKMETPPANE
ncbi:hypothetical protein MTR67_045932 [Solanum verrucosum]|uniref:Uncharacterized protein n=1 Tax=Solanum verrucosum TaxID=315347 RepID=A0AAF0ZU71_SOLVR|nr:hypothetical protein MTR67_045932 [Solanum verrucosum]